MIRIRNLTAAIAVAAAIVPVGASAETIQQWRRWEKTITAQRDYSLNQGNPYRDLILRVRFTYDDTGGYFIQDAFWTGNTGTPTQPSPTQFKVRAALPPGSWTWRVEGCIGSTPPTNGQDCATDPNLLPGAASGTINVQAFTSSNIKLYDRGMPTQMMATGGGQTVFSPLLYPDGTWFFWGGDTAWAAPPREISPTQSPNKWGDYLLNRRNKGFTVVLVAPAAAWTAGSDWPALPGADGFSFIQVGSCSQPIPNDCSRPAPDYWNKFDEMVKKANDQDLLVGIVGVLDPVVRGVDYTFPNSANAQDFARYLAARMAGSHVVFSPGFDTWVTHHTQGGTLIETVMNSVGNALVAASGLQLVTNHLAGQSPCTDYQRFQASGWMTFHLFQSGHAKTTQGSISQVCPGRLSGESSQRAAIRRAREMPLTLRSYTGPRMPNINGEALYDGHPTAAEPDTRYRVRQAGHVSLLSGASGFTYGTHRLWQWYQVSNTIFNLSSASDMQTLILRFRDRFFKLLPRHNLVLNQVADPNHEYKMVLASDDVSTLIAYLPGGPGSATSIMIDTSGFPTLTCANSLWTKKWYNPPNNALSTNVGCTQGTNKITLSRPTTCGNSDCDWVLELYNSSLSTLTPPTPQATLAVWANLSPDDGTSAIWGELGDGGPFVISPSGESFQQSPQVAPLADGYLVVWHAEGLDGSLLGVFAQQVDAAGRLIDRRFQVNQETNHDQRDPVIASDALGNAIVVWSSHGQDGDGGAILGRRFDGSGWPQGDEFLVNTTSSGYQETPVVAFDPGGGFVIAWATRAGGRKGAAVSYQRYDATARPLGGEVQIDGGAYRMRPAAILSSGDVVTLRWASEGSRGDAEFSTRRIDSMGRAMQ